MTDIVERLRAGTGGGKHWMELHEEAADEIFRLRIALTEWHKFAADVEPSDFAGHQWLDALNHRTLKLLGGKP